jgi:hypothetical protein
MRRPGLALVLVLSVALGVWWCGRAPSAPGGDALRATGAAREPQPGSAEPADLQEARAPELARGSREAAASSAPAESGLVLTGRVLECAAGATTGVPAAGVVVQVAAEADMGLGAIGYADGGAVEPTGPTTRTGADGAFRMVLPDDGKRPWRRWLSVEGDARFRQATLECRLEAGEMRRGGLELVRRAFGALSGRTLDLEGRPVADVEVVVLRWDEAGEALVDGQTVRSDEQGRFTLASVDAVHSLEARKPGHTLLEGASPKLAQDGTWSELELVLSASGELRVRVTDPAGAPVPRVNVAVEIAAAERVARRGWSDSLRTARQAETGADGVARLPAVWAGQRLRVTLRRLGVQESPVLGAFERVDGARAVLAEDGSGAPLVLAAGELRELGVELAVRLRISGQVLDALRAPYPEPFVTLRALDRPASAPDALRREVRGDALGRFELELLAPRPLGKVLLEAVDIGMITPSRAAQLGASLVLDLGGRTSGEEEVTLVLEPRRVIAGRLLADPPVVARVSARPVAGALPFGLGPSAAVRACYAGKKGEFRLLGLPAGRYDLEIAPSSTFPIHRVSGVEAGTEDLLVPLAGAKAARVVVEVALADGDLAETILLTARLRPHGVPPGAAELPRQARLGALEGWPPTLVEFWSGSGGRTDAQGTTSYSLDSMTENPWTLELDPGLHWIGVKARAKDGNLTLPIGTGLVRVEAGEYRLRFELTPSGAVRGRVHGADGRERSAALARGGALLALDVRQDELRTVCELGADGYFAFPLAPAGALELRVGTREELLAGRWSHRQELELARGAELWLDVRL